MPLPQLSREDLNLPLVMAGTDGIEWPPSGAMQRRLRVPFVSDAYGFIYFAAPATGSSVTLKAFLRAKIGHMVPADEMFQDGKLICPSKHGTYRDMLDNGLITERQ